MIAMIALIATVSTETVRIFLYIFKKWLDTPCALPTAIIADFAISGGRTT